MAHMAQQGGNTIPPAHKRIRSRRWVFTLNNWTEEEYQSIHNYMAHKSKYFIIGEEKGEQGTPHLQGYVEFKNPIDFSSIKNICNRLHLEKTRGSRKQNIDYCSKEKVKITTFPLSIKDTILKKEYQDTTWHPWQQQVIDIINKSPDSRTIHWFWEPRGNVGKTYLCKWLAIQHNIILASGKKADIFNQVKTWFDNNEEGTYPQIVILDVPRTSTDYVSYEAIECLKNGMLYSGKYEGGICLFPHPHVICFANSPPNLFKLSSDRWSIVEINQKSY